MKFSSETVDLLKNFCNINPNILVNEGNVVRTISPQRNIFAKATIAESFPQKFAIYDLGSFITSLTLFADAEVTFGDKFATFVFADGGSNIKYFYSEPNIVQAAPTDEIKLDDLLYQFDLSLTGLQTVTKAIGALVAPHVWVKSSDGQAILFVGDRANATANTFSMVLGESGKKFNVALGVASLKVFPGDYTVSINTKNTSARKMGVWVMKNKTTDVQYWMTTNTDSTLE